MAIQKKHSLAPIEDDDGLNLGPVMEEKINNEKKKEANRITEDSNVESYIKEEKKNEYSEKDAIIDVQNEKILELEEKVKKLEAENTDYIERMNSMIYELEQAKKSTKDIEVNKTETYKKIESLQSENDDLILKNSELEFDIAKLTVQVKKLQENIDSMNHTYTKNGYSRVQANNTRRRAVGFVPSMNGYQDWR